MPEGFWTIWTTVALDLVGFGIVAPILGRYAERFDASGVEVGALFASFSLAQMVFSPVLGRLSDRIGRKPVIVVSLVGTCIGSLVTGAAGALWVLFLGRIIDGASGASVAVAQGAIADIAPPERRAQLLGMLGAAFGVGFVLGPALGGLAALGGPHVPFFVAAAVAGTNAVVAAVRLPETRGTRPPARESDAAERHVLRTPALTSMAAVSFVSVLAFAGFEATFALLGERRFDLTEGSAAVLFLFVGVLLTVVQGVVIGPLTERFGSLRLMGTGLVVVAAGMFAMSAATSWWLLIVALALLALGQGVNGPSNTTLVTQLAPPERRGEALGYVQSAGALARIAGPLLAGVLFDKVGIASPYVVGGVLTLLAAVLLARRRLLVSPARSR